jgi:hypothetical protein
MTQKHKKNVVESFPDTLCKKYINGIPMTTNKLDLKKRKEYIKIIELDIDIDKDKDIIKVTPITITEEMYEKEYFQLNNNEMTKLINNFIKFINNNNKKLEDWFNHEEYITNINNNNTIVDTYCEIRDVILDDDMREDLLSIS